MEGLALEAGFGIVKYFVGSLMQHLKDNKELIEHANEDVRKLENDYNALQRYIEHSVKNPKISDDVITNTLIKEVRDVVYEAEDAVDSYIMEVTKSKSQWFSGSIPREATAEVAKVIQSVATKLDDIRKRFESRIDMTGHGAGTGYEVLGEYEGPPANRNFAPIFEDKEKLLKQLLTREAQKPEVIVITGTHDIGKTMLAAKMFYDSHIEFDERIWIGVSNPTTRNILLAILRQQDKLPQNESWKNDSELSELVRDCLKEKKFLLVMDNVWKIEDRARLESAFQSSDNKSKVLITSYNEELAKLIVTNESFITKLEPLNIVDSWNMLQWRVQQCPHQLKTLGLTIAKNSYGMPRAIMDACDFLIKRDSVTNEMSRRKKLWEDVSRGLITDFSEATGTGTGKHNTGIESNYNDLPYRLRACFLYLGLFKQQSDLSVSKLIRMWIAEGFVRPSDKATLEETAQLYLSILINRNLVVPKEYRPDGSLTKCSLNVRLHQFCETEGGKGKENFLQEFKKCLGDKDFNPSITGAEKNRRVCIHDGISNFIRQFISITRDSLQIRVRSFVSHDTDDKVVILESGDISDILAAFKLLRVMDAKPMKFKKIHTRLCELAHLRFVTLSIDGKTLPAAVSKLRKIQTLIVHTEASSLKIEADILTMDELRHFKTNASATLPKTSKASRQNDSLQTLCGISPKSCTKGFFEKTPNLKKLGIRGELVMLLDDKNGPLSGLTSVEKLKLVNRTTNPKYEGKLSLQRLQFPLNLMSLTLSATRLSWDHISMLGCLQKLKALKLKDNAFVGTEWKVHGKGFPNLETLHIESSDFTEWKSSSAHFPELTFLTLSKCEKLKEIPIDFSEIGTLRKLYLRHGNTSAAESAREIKKKMNCSRQIGLDLSITPDEL